jgi:hypothetical protein
VTKDKLSGIVVLLVGIIMMVLTTQVKGNQYSTAIGPELFPNIASGGMILCSLGLIFRKQQNKDKPMFSKDGWIRVMKISVTLIAYPIILDYLGFIVGAFYLLYVTVTLFDLEKKLKLYQRVTFATGFTIFAYVFFNNILRVLLPTGKIFDMLFE